MPSNGVETSAQYPGLGGFSYEEVFGMDENHTTWQCRRACDGSVDVSVFTQADLDSSSFLYSIDRMEKGIVDMSLVKKKRRVRLELHSIPATIHAGLSQSGLLVI